MDYKVNEPTITLTANDGHRLNIYCWDRVENPRAVLQIFHGMSEHAGRYGRFARYLNSKGIVVYGNDHRGHGKTAFFNGKRGVIGKDGFNKIVEDEYMITKMLKHKYCNIPLFIFAHSFGSFVGQEYITRYSKEISGIILSGSAAQTGVKFKLAKMLSYVCMKLFGEEKESKLLDKLSIGSNNKRIAPDDKTNWLSRDINEVKKYADDPDCGFPCSNGFYYYLSRGLTKLYQKDKLDRISKMLPIHIISGQEDPVGEYGERVKKLYDIYKRLGVTDLKIRLYEDCRHELLNELNRNEVSEDILNWINSRISL